MNKTIFVDIDATIFEQGATLSGQLVPYLNLLPGVLEKFNQWNKSGYYIILTTGRKESCRESTIYQLIGARLFWDQLVMGLPRGQRILINNFKETAEECWSKQVANEHYTPEPMAVAINVFKNEGLEDLDND